MGKAGRKEKQARERAEVIMKVRCGLLTAKEAAKVLGVSRKTYYKWEQRGLQALLGGLEDRDVGRPAEPDREETKTREQQLAGLLRENELLKKKMELKDLMFELKVGKAASAAKKK